MKLTKRHLTLLQEIVDSPGTWLHYLSQPKTKKDLKAAGLIYYGTLSPVDDSGGCYPGEGAARALANPQLDYPALSASEVARRSRALPAPARVARTVTLTEDDWDFLASYAVSGEVDRAIELLIKNGRRAVKALQRKYER